MLHARESGAGRIVWRYTFAMVKSAATNADQYIAELPDDRREAVATMRAFIQKHLPAGYVETVNWGVIMYVIPLDQYPTTHNGEPLGYIGISAQKNYYALYMLSLYMADFAGEGRTEPLRAQFAAAGKKMDMGKSCLRFRSVDDLVLPALADVIASTPPERYIELYEAGRGKAKTAPKKKRA